MKKHHNKKNRTMHRAGAILLSFVLSFSLLMPSGLSVWAEDNTPDETDVSYETLETVTEEVQEDLVEDVNEEDGALGVEGLISEENNDAVTADDPMDWAAAQTWINEASSDETGKTLVLEQSLVASDSDGPLTFPAGKTLTIDLNGYTIDRHLQAPEADGSVIVNNGSLTIVDSSEGKTGKITGGNTTGNGGGIVNTATLNLNGGTVTGNTAGGHGGGVYNEFLVRMDGGTITGNEAGGIAGGVYTIRGQRLIISNGSITDNKAEITAGGVWFGISGNNGALIVGGKVTITGNAVTGEDNENNVYLHRGAPIRVSEVLDGESLIGIMTEEKPGENSAVDITVANSGKAKAYNFTSDDPEYGIFQELEGEVKLVVPVKVSFEKGHPDATGEMREVTAGKGIDYTAPSCGFDFAGGAFIGWYVNGDTENIVKIGEKLIFTEDAVLTAVWDTSPWKELQSKIDHARDGEKIVLDPDKEYIAGDDDVALRVPSGKNITLDLNGQTIDRNLMVKDPVVDGYVIRVAGTLTIEDSGSGSGRITGGNNSGSFPRQETGGGIHITSSGKVTLKSGKIINNQAQSAAGISNNGTLIMEGGSVEYNTAASFSGGVDGVHGTTYIKGGTITRNDAGQLAGGVYASSSTYFSGNPVITGNKAAGADENVHLDRNATLRIDDAIGEGALIFISRDLREYEGAPVTMTIGLPGNGTIDAFRPDDSTYVKGYDENGEMVFGKTGASVSYDGTEGSGAMEGVTVCKGAYWLLPECGFTAPSGFVFDCWKTDDGQSYNAGELVPIEGDTTFYAAWKDGPVSLTLRWSSGDGVDLKEPMVISDIDKYKTFGDVFLLNSNRIDRYFSTDGYEKEGGHSEYGLFLWRPVADFASTAEARSGDNQVNVNERLITDREIYIVYSKNQNEVDITLDPILCGTDTSEAAPSARVDETYYCNLGSAEWLDSSVNRTLVGEEEAKLKIIIKPKAGIIFPRNPVVTVNGDQAPVESSFADGPLYVNISAPVVHVPGEVQIENVKPPTCTEPGSHEENVYCTQEICEHKLISSETVETDPALGHDWGEWVVTKPATETEEGVETRTCKNDPAHTETRVIPKTEPAPGPSPAPGTDPDQKGSDGTPVGPGASEASADIAITSDTTDEGPAGTRYSPLRLQSKKQAKTSIKLTWANLNGAAEYVVYGALSGKSNRMTRLASIGTNTMTVKDIGGVKLKKGKYYKFIVVALDSNKTVISTSKVAHVATKGGKVGNHKKVTVKKSAVSKAKKLKAGKTLKLKAKAVKAGKKVKKRRAVSYESTDPGIATVSRKGVVKGVQKGTCYIYAYAQNGVAKKIKVVIK